jgi:iron complex outermembrane receptor protein
MLQHPKFTAIALAVASLAQPAFSADTEAPEVIVTATRFAAPSNFLPVGASVITAQQIADSAASSLPEVLSRLGGIALRNNSGDASPQVDLRGFGMTGDQNTLILLDGQRISENEMAPARLSAIPLDAVERIEILPGSGAVLYGAGATGGTINIITRHARYGQTSGSVSAGIGGFGTRQAAAQVSTGGDSMALSLHASNDESDNFRQNNRLTDRVLDSDLRVKGPGGEAWAKFGATRESTGLPGSLTVAQAASNPTAASTPNNHSTLDTWHASLGGSADLFGGELAAELGHRSKSGRSAYAPNGTSVTDSGVLSFSPRYRLPYRLAGMDGTLVLGADWDQWGYRSRIDAPSWFYYSDATGSQRDTAFYFQNLSELMPGTHFTAGARWQHVSTFRTENIPAPTPQSRADSLTAFELGLRQRLDANVSLYGRWGSSFRVANVDDNGYTPPGIGLLNPQTSHDAEIGVEYGKGGRHTRAALFQSLVNNEIHALNYPGSWGYNVNLPPTLHRGLELDGAWPLTDSFSLSANYRLTEATFREGFAGGTPISGNQIPLVARHRLTASADWKPADGYTLAGSVRYVGRQRFDNDQVNAFGDMPAYTVVDLKLTRKIEQWKLSLAVDNLFNRNYYSYGNVPDPSVASYNVYPEAGRRLFANAEYRF